MNFKVFFRAHWMFQLGWQMSFFRLLNFLIVDRFLFRCEFSIFHQWVFVFIGDLICVDSPLDLKFRFSCVQVQLGNLHLSHLSVVLPTQRAYRFFLPDPGTLGSLWLELRALLLTVCSLLRLYVGDLMI